MRTLIMLLKRQFLCGKKKPRIGSYMLIFSYYVSFASDASCSVSSLMFSNYEDTDV